MAGMLVAGGRAMSRTDSSNSSGNTPSRSTSSKADSAVGGGDGYIEVNDDGASPRGTGNGQHQSSAEPPGVSGRTRGSNGRGSGSVSRRASPRRTTSESYYAGGSGVGGVGSSRGAGGDTRDDGRECVICMEDFTKEDPEMLTLCSCGVNKTFFHYSCLLQWLAKHSHCPACRGYLYFEERHRGAGESSGSAAGARTRSGSASNEDYGQAFQRALRAGLDAAGEGDGVKNREYGTA